MTKDERRAIKLSVSDGINNAKHRLMNEMRRLEDAGLQTLATQLGKKIAALEAFQFRLR